MQGKKLNVHNLLLRLHIHMWEYVGNYLLPAELATQIPYRFYFTCTA